MPIALLDLQFSATRPIRSLPPWHGARWNALLRLVAKSAGLKAETCFAGLVPFRSGRSAWRTHDAIRLRLLVRTETLPITTLLLAALAKNRTEEGEFCLGKSLKFEGVLAPTTLSHLSTLPVAEAQSVAAPLGADILHKEADCLRSLGAWTLCIHSPARLTLPAGAKSEQRYLSPEYLVQSPAAAFACFLSRVRWVDAMDAAPVCMPRSLRVELQWEDIAYSASRRMRLGGVVGRLYCEGELDMPTATRLVAGQYTGVGKNVRFGMGMYSIPELAGVRTFRLPDAQRM